MGIALIAFSEDIGTDMAIRTLNHFMQYCEAPLKKTVPLALGLLRVGNPTDASVLDLLSKLSFDSDAQVAMSAIFA